MFLVILCMLAGLTGGYALRRWQPLRHVDMTISWTIAFLLFVMGLAVGNDPVIMRGLGRYGLEALWIALAGTAGSAFASYALFAADRRHFTHLYKEEKPQASGNKTQAADYAQSLLILAAFIAGCLIGGCITPRPMFHTFSAYVLYALMFQVGLSVGRSDQLPTLIRTFRPALVLLPIGTIAGTLFFTTIPALLISDRPLADTLAVSAGMGYYSLSSILISQLKAPLLGVQAATELGIIALLANILRELFAILTAPVLCRRLGPLAPVAASGVTSVDVALPTLTRVAGPGVIPIALFHGMALDLSVPLLVSVFCG